MNMAQKTLVEAARDIVRLIQEGNAQYIDETVLQLAVDDEISKIAGEHMNRALSASPEQPSREELIEALRYLCDRHDDGALTGDVEVEACLRDARALLARVGGAK